MKTIIFTIAFLLSISSIFSQRATKITRKIFSENEQYHVQVKGYQYEGFVGDQQITLINASDDTLWKQVVPRRFLIYPSVSNMGDVAITHREIKLFDKYNQLKGVLPLKKGESPYNVEDYMGSVHGFSFKGDRYFIAMFVGSPDNAVVLFCLSDSAKIIWKKNLGNYRPSGILFYDDKIIMHDSRTAGVDYQNYCYIFDSVGNIIWKYQPNEKGLSDWNVILDKNKGILYAKDKIVETQVKLDTLIYSGP